MAKFTFRENLIDEIVQYFNSLVVREAAEAKSELRLPLHLN